MSKESANRCSSCQENLNNREEIEMITPCGHYFHRDCLRKHQQAGKSQCPVCRVETTLTTSPGAKRSNIVDSTTKKSPLTVGEEHF